LDYSRCTKKQGHLAWLNERFREAIKVADRDITAFYIPAHAGLGGNESADKLAVVSPEEERATGAAEVFTHTTKKEIATRARHDHWLSWFAQKTHHYSVRKPSRRVKHLEGLTRRDASVILRLRTNKGWSPTGPNEEPPDCDTCGVPREALHIMGACPIYAEKRPSTDVKVRAQLCRFYPPPRLLWPALRG
jgi:hypothetical protein